MNQEEYKGYFSNIILGSNITNKIWKLNDDNAYMIFKNDAHTAISEIMDAVSISIDNKVFCKVG